MSYVDERIKKDCGDKELKGAFENEGERLEIAIALMRLREEEGLTQQQLAEKSRETTISHRPNRKRHA